MYLKIHKFLPFTRVEGPGKRACIWVQGCSIRCSGCAVPQTWSPEEGKKVNVEKLAEKILDNPEIEGVTFMGGEPFDQARSLAYLSKILKKSGLSILTFTGRLIEDIQNSKNSDWLDLLSVTDLLIDGPYIKEKSDLSRPWVGSSNQRYHFLTSRYEDIKPKLLDIPNCVEIRIQEDGIITINGMLTSANLEEILDNIQTNKVS